MSLPWTRQQCEWLRALGHPVLMPLGVDDGARGAAEPEIARPDVAAVDGTPPAPERPAADRGPRLGIPQPRPMRPVLVEPGVAEAAATPAPRLDLSDALYRALLRATAQRTPREGQALLETLSIDLRALREDAGSKPALWRDLRAARKARRA